MLMRIDPTSEAPIFAQLAASIRADAAAGRVKPGDRLPAAREVAGALDVNVHTVLHAYQALRDEGLVDLRRGRGAVISSAATSLVELHDDIRSLLARAAVLGIPAASVVALVQSLLSHPIPEEHPA